LNKTQHKQKTPGTLSGSKAETNDDAASTSRSKSIQPNNLDLAFDKSNVDYQQKLFLLKNKWDIPSSLNHVKAPHLGLLLTFFAI
jgi:hypothetical protein